MPIWVALTRTTNCVRATEQIALATSDGATCFSLWQTLVSPIREFCPKIHVMCHLCLAAMIARSFACKLQQFCGTASQAAGHINLAGNATLLCGLCHLNTVTV